MTLSRWLPALRTRLRALLRRSRLERDLEAEIRFHLDRQIAEHLERGLSPREARRSDLAAFGGGRSRQGDVARPMGVPRRGGGGARYAPRGAPAAAQSGIHARRGAVARSRAHGVDAERGERVPVAPAAVPDAGNLVVLAAERPNRAAPTNLSFPNYRDIEERSTAFSGLAAYVPTPAGLRAGRSAERTWGQGVSANYFDVLGIRPERGRFLHRGGCGSFVDGVRRAQPSLVDRSVRSGSAGRRPNGAPQRVSDRRDRRRAGWIPRNSRLPAGRVLGAAQDGGARRARSTGRPAGERVSHVRQAGAGCDPGPGPGRRRHDHGGASGGTSGRESRSANAGGSRDGCTPGGRCGQHGSVHRVPAGARGGDRPGDSGRQCHGSVARAIDVDCWRPLWARPRCRGWNRRPTCRRSSTFVRTGP